MISGTYISDRFKEVRLILTEISDFTCVVALRVVQMVEHTITIQ